MDENEIPTELKRATIYIYVRNIHVRVKCE